MLAAIQKHNRAVAQVLKDYGWLADHASKTNINTTDALYLTARKKNRFQILAQLSQIDQIMNQLINLPSLFRRAISLIDVMKTQIDNYSSWI